MTSEAWFVRWVPSLLFAAVLMIGALIIRRRHGRGALPLFALFLLLACVGSCMLSQAIGPSTSNP